ncbi:nuclear transport factor 2 family protein [Nonomuraea glycinis]|uniref:nuclear transport factor 2 family protein n=1 Tax=Nonomuraea glycinis TaxID=2047744 RepID=UPI0033BEA555
MSGTRVFERGAGAWVLVHQHLSIPYDLETGGGEGRSVSLTASLTGRSSPCRR